MGRLFFSFEQCPLNEKVEMKMKKLMFVLSIIIFTVVLLVTIVQAKVIRDAIWCHNAASLAAMIQTLMESS